MENLGDILKRLATTKELTNGEPPRQTPEDPCDDSGQCAVCNGRGWFTTNVPVGHPEFGQVVTCECQQERLLQERAARLIRYSNLGHLTRFSFESLDPDGLDEEPESQDMFRVAYRTALEYAKNPSGWLVIVGPHGSGKTHLVAAIANRCIQEGRPVFFVHVPDLLDHLRGSFVPDGDVSYSDLFEQVRNSSLLILDGLGGQNATPWTEEKLQQIFNHRYNTELPTVVTTANDLGELDPHIRSRLEAKDLSRVVEVRSWQPRSTRSLGEIEPQMAHRMTFEAFDMRGNDSDDSQRASLEGACAAARNFAADPEGWLTLFGDTGVGKTHLAVAISVERIKGGHPAFFAFVPELLDYLRYTFSPGSKVAYDHLFDKVKNAPLLVLDDLGQEYSSPWAEEKLYQIIVHRHNARLPTVITSTLEFSEQTGPISSRVRDPYVGQLIKIGAPDYRIKTKGQKGRMGSDSPGRKRLRAG